MGRYMEIEPHRSYWRREVVLYRGDDIIDQGTIKELAERRGVRKDTIYWMTMPTAARRADTRKKQDKALRAVMV